MIRYEVERGQEWLGTFRGRGWDQEQKKNKRKEIKQTNKPARESKGCWTTIADSRRHNLHGSFQREAGVVWATNRAGYTRFLMTWLLGVCGVIPEAMVSYQGFGVWHAWMFPQHGDVFMWYILLFALWIFFFYSSNCCNFPSDCQVKISSRFKCCDLKKCCQLVWKRKKNVLTGGRCRYMIIKNAARGEKKFNSSITEVEELKSNSASVSSREEYLMLF